jgi:glycosyltransferase involved in cell wall biosynthesis
MISAPEKNLAAPAISVIMPVYNSGEFLREAIDSILSQTFTNFEFLIFEDGSLDDSKQIIQSYTDNRIKLLADNQNRGIANRINQGIDIARGKYIARMDSDDVAAPNRFQLQYQYLEQHPDIALCGSFFTFIGGNAFNWVSHQDHEMIKINLLFDGAICHPTVMARRGAFTGDLKYFNPEFEPSEDYEMWVRMSKHLKFANLPQALLQYRINGNQVSNRKNERQRHYKFVAIKEQLSHLHITPTDIELRIHDHAFYPTVITSYDYLPKVKSWFDKLKAANAIYEIYAEPQFVNYLDDLYRENQKQFVQKVRQLTIKKKAEFYLKCLLRWQSIR